MDNVQKEGWWRVQLALHPILVNSLSVPCENNLTTLLGENHFPYTLGTVPSAYGTFTYFLDKDF